MTETKRGWHIVVDGIDGVGKSTLCDSLADALRERGRSVQQASPFGRYTTGTGTHISRILRDPSEGSYLEPDAECALIIAATAQLSTRIVKPALAEARS